MAEAKEFVFVTGNLKVDTEKDAKRVEKAFNDVCRHKTVTIYILGSMFGPGVSRDGAIRFLNSLPGRKILVWDDNCPVWQRNLSKWFMSEDMFEIKVWGKNFRLGCTLPRVSEPGVLYVHTDKTVLDTGNTVNTSWDEWADDFGGVGLQSLYALSVYAEGLANGMALAK